MEFNHFIGTDVSKNQFDLAVRQGKSLLFHRQIDNRPAAIRAFLQELRNCPASGWTKSSSGLAGPEEKGRDHARQSRNEPAYRQDCFRVGGRPVLEGQLVRS